MEVLQYVKGKGTSNQMQFENKRHVKLSNLVKIMKIDWKIRKLLDFETL